jgi:pilus assembly protein FimV
LGISRQYILTKLQFKPAVRDGVPVILVTTKKPVKEPFLDFLLEVRWPKGRLLREYTVLLDPPVMMEQRAVATRAPEVTEAPAEMAPEPAAEPALPPASVAVIEPEPAAEPEPVVLPEPVAAAEPEPEAYVAPAPEPEPVMLPDEPMAYEPQEDALFPLIPIGGEEVSSYYAEAEPEAEMADGYKVAANDTLWEIANQARPEGVSVNQMMVAMLRANPDAFYQNNINNLKRGVILRMPTQEELEAVESQAANTEVSEQYALWREYRAQVAGAAIPQEAVPAVEETAEAVTEEAEVVEAEQPAAELQILAPDSAAETGETVMAGGEDVASLQNDLALARESLESARQENQDLASRVEQLEQMLQKQERLMNLKDEQLSDLQQQVEGVAAAAPAEEMMAAQAPETQAPVMEAEAKPVVEPVTETPMAEVVSPEEVEGEATVEEAVVAEQMPAEGQPEEPIAVVEEEVVAVVEPPAEPVAAPPVQPEPVQKPELEAPAPAKAPSLMGDLLSDPKMLGIVGGGVLLVLALIATLLRRMGKNREAKAAAAAAPAPVFEEPVFEEAPAAFEEAAEAEPEAVEEAPAEGVPAEEAPMVGDSTQVLDLSKQEAVAEAAAEAAAEADDTISEADVYLAYGLHQQCEDLLKNAIDQNPDRNDYRAKLLENYFASKEQDKFEVVASELHDKLGDASDPIWSRVVVMGRELAPDNALFKDVDVGDLSIDDIVQEKPDAAEFDLTAEDLAVGAVEEIEEIEEAATEEMAEVKAEADAGLEFDIGDIDLGDLDLGEAGAEVKETDDTATLDIESDLEIDAGELDIEELGDDISASDLDLDVEPQESAAETEVMTELPSSPETMIMEGPPDIDLATQAEAEKHDTGTLDISDMDLGDLDLGEDVGDVSSDLDLDESVDFGGPENEVTEEMKDDAASFDLGEEMDLEEDLGLPDSEDEVSTKLDLAKAYIDMGDNDGAKSTLEEVMNEGDDDQKKEAQDLLSQIS